MSIRDLQSTIESFRNWISGRAAAVLGPAHGGAVAQWGEDLTAAERLLEEKAELPIAFLGPSQQGKSSLINALLGENILAVGGAVGACTCVITSVHYRPAADYRAEIEFISLPDWREELRAIQEALDSAPSAEDTTLDREEWEAEQKAALEKFKAVYRTDPPADLSGLLDDPALGLPVELARAMVSGGPLEFEEKSAATLRNTVRRYLVGRNQSEDGQYWPLISRVRIYGNFDVLKNGVVLVDLPGLNDPNPAREQVTKRYLQDARHIWLVCNSQTGIDRVFTRILREEALLFRLFLEGRLDAFSVVATRIDDINLEAVLQQMGIDAGDYDGDYAGPLEFRRSEVAGYIQSHLLEIAGDIVARAESPEHRESFLDRVRAIPAFSVSTAAYLHAIGRMPLYQGMKLTLEESHLPRLIEHLHSITLEHSYKMQVQASSRRLQILRDQIRRFFLSRIRQIEADSQQAREEWDQFCGVAEGAVGKARGGMEQVRVRAEAGLQERCSAFEQRLTEFEARAALALNSVFADWDGIHWRTLQAAVTRQGKWFSRSLGREFDFNRDVARAYLDLLPFVWEEFFGTHLSSLVRETASRTRGELNNMAHSLTGAMQMLHHQPEGLREGMEAGLKTAEESFRLQSDHVIAALMGQIQRTRQSLSNGMVETAASFMGPAYEEASQVDAGTGVKARMLRVLVHHATREAPALFVTMREELGEGVATLRGSMIPQLARLVENGERIVGQFQQNLTTHQVLTPAQRAELESALDELPDVGHDPEESVEESEDGSMDQVVGTGRAV